MAENTETVKSKKGSSSRKQVGGNSEPCPVSNPEKQLVVLVAAAGVGPLDGVNIKVIDAARKKKSAPTAKGIAVFTKLAPGACAIQTDLSRSQAKAYFPATGTAQVTADGFAEVVLKLQSTTLDLRPVIKTRAPVGLFNPSENKGEKLRVNLSLVGNPVAKQRCKVVLKREGNAQVFKDSGCTQELTFTGNKAAIDRAGLENDAAVSLWVTSTNKNPFKLTLAVEPDAKAAPPKDKKFALPDAAESAPLTLTWRDAALEPVIESVSTLVLGSPFAVTCQLADADRVGVEAKLAIHDKDGALVRALATRDLAAENDPTWTVDWDGEDGAKKPVLLEKSPYEVVLEVTDRFGGKRTKKQKFSMTPPQSFIAIQFKDPEGTERALPEGLPLEVVFDDGTVDKVKLGAGGIILGTDGKPGVILDPLRQGAVLRFPKSDEPSYLVCEPPGQPVAEALLKTADEFKTWHDDPAPAKKGARGFLLPRVDWTTAESIWTAADDDARFDPVAGALKPHGLPIGKAEKPARLLLDPRWQYARLTYQDRMRGGAEQVSSLPLSLAGFAARPTKKTDLETTRSNWTVGDNAEKAVQCLPWIVRAKAAPQIAPAATSELRFETAENTFIETPLKKDEPRAWAVGPQAQVNADRLRFYDLPKEWRSQNWYVRNLPQGSDGTGKFYFELASVAARLGSKDAPLIFSLDDIVLYTCPDRAKPTELKPLPALAADQPVAVFHNSFRQGGDDGKTIDLTPEGLFLPVATPAKGTLAKIEDVRWPASKDEVLARAGAPTRPLKENYVYRYPDWTRLVIAEGNVFDVFAARSTPVDTTPDLVVGARAAVRLVDVAAPIADVTQEGANAAGTHPPVPKSEIKPRPVAVKAAHLTVQPLVEFHRPIANVRLDAYRLGDAPTGTASTEPSDFGQSYGRDSRRIDEPASPAPANELGQIGRFDALLIRCAGLDLTDPGKPIERAVQLSYFRLSCAFDQSLRDDETKRGAWIQETMEGLSLRWNGVDGDFNPGRALIEPRDLESRPDKFTVTAMRLFQNVPDSLAAIRFKVIGKKPGARDYMNTAYGETQAQDGNERPASNGRFTAAHEMGHGGGLLDDYCELWNHASYYQPGVPMLVPGDPYIFDQIEGSESMMHGNKEVRGRHFWQMAEWVRGQLPDEIELQIRHGGGNPYFLPHHAHNRTATPTAYRSYLTFPWAAAVDVALEPTKKARYDAYLWALGDDFYSRTVLPGRAGADYLNQAFDGVLCVTVAICLNFDGIVDHELIRHASSAVVTTLRKTFSDRVVASFRAGGRTFERCLVVFSPRIIVGTHAGDDGYDAGLGLDKNAKAPVWQGATPYSVGDQVAPTTSNGFIYECNRRFKGAKLTGAMEPAWPKSKGVPVRDGQIEWIAVPVAEARRPLYDALLKSKLRWNPLHVVVEMGAATSELVEPATALPRIRIASQQVLVWRETSALATQICKAQLAAKAEADKAARTALNESKSAKSDYNAASLELTQALDNYNAAKLDYETKLATYQLSVSNNAANNVLQTQYQQMSNARALQLSAYQTYETKYTTADEKLAAMNLAIDEYDAAAAVRNAIRVASSIGNVLARGQTMVDSLFNAATNPLTDAGYTDLKTQIGLLAAAAAAVGATRDKVCAKLTSTQAAVVAAKAALMELAPNCAPKDVAAIGNQLLTVAKKIEAFATLGTDDKDKKKRAADARVAVQKMAAAAVVSRNTRFEALKTQVAGGWSALDYNKAESIADAERGCASGVSDDLRALYVKNAPATLEEQINQHFASWLGVETNPQSKVGFDGLVTSVCDSLSPITLEIPRPPPPPIFNPPPQSQDGSNQVPTVGLLEAINLVKLKPPAKPKPPIDDKPPQPPEDK